MLEFLKKSYKQFPEVGMVEFAQLLKVSRLRKFEKGDVIVRQGDLNYCVIVVMKGLVRNFMMDSRGEERTILFSSEGMSTGSHACILHDKPANDTIEALEDCTLVYQDVRELRELGKRYPKILMAHVEMLKSNLSDTIDRLTYHTVMSPEERFIHFRENYPGLVSRVPQKYLASFLGVTPVSLSRMKARIDKRPT